MKVCETNQLISKNTTGLLRIVFEVMVLLHHLYPFATALGHKVSEIMGPIAVCGFLLISGYGVGISFKKRGDSYLKKLGTSRIPITYLTIVLVDLLYLILFYADNRYFGNASSFLLSVFYMPISSEFTYLSHWIYFLADLLIYYLLFLGLACIFKKRDDALKKTAISMLILSGIVILVLTIINTTTGSSRYLRACVAFPVGLLLANYANELHKIIKAHKWKIFSLLLTLGISFFCIANVPILCEYFTCLLFCLAIVVLINGKEIQSKFVSFATPLVLYVYVSHELFFKLLMLSDIAKMRWLVMIITVSCAIAFALAVHFGLKYGAPLLSKVFANIKEKRMASIKAKGVKTKSNKVNQY